MATLKTLIYLIVYPGLLFLFIYSTFIEWYDRKLYAAGNYPLRKDWKYERPAEVIPGGKK